MNDMMRKLVFGLGGAFLMVATSLTAANTDKTDSCETDCCDSCGGQWSAGVEWLYWRPCADTVYVAVTGEITSVCDDCTESIPVASARARNFDFDLSSGFRLGLGYSNPDCYCFDVSLVWTHFNPHEDGTVKVPNPPTSTSTFIFPFFCQNFLFSGSPFSGLDSDSFVTSFSVQAELVKADWELQLNLVDLDFSFAYCLNECFQLHPFFGVRYAQVDQSLRSKAIFEFSTTRVDQLRQRYSNEFSGVGPHGGVGATWDLGCGFGLYGDFGLTIAYGDKNSKSKIAFEARDNGVILSSPAPFKQKGSDDGRCSRTITDLGFGGTYDFEPCDCVETSIRLGWEHHYFFNQGVADGTAGCLQLAKSVNSDLSTQGLTFGINLAY